MEPDRIYPSDFVKVENIPCDIRYATSDNFTGKPLPGYIRARAVMRRPVAIALRNVQYSLSKRGYSLCILDAYRPCRAVRFMVRWAEQFRPEYLSQNYISRQSNHSRGTAVDVTLLKKSLLGRLDLVDMGTGFDTFSEFSHTSCPNIETPCKAARRLLLHEMNRHGFTNYHREWWHYTFDHLIVPRIWYDFPIR